MATFHNFLPGSTWFCTWRTLENQKILVIAIGDFKINCNYYIKLFFTYVEVFNGWLKKSKPEAVKASFIKKVTIASTMGVGLEINVVSLR